MQSFKAVELYKQGASGSDAERLAGASACASTAHRLFVANGGNVHVFSRGLKSVFSFPGQPEVQHLTSLRDGRLLVALGSRNPQEPVSSACITFWHFNVRSAVEARLAYQYDLFQQLGKSVRQQRVTAWACHDDDHKVLAAVGLHTSPPTLVVLEFKVVTTANATCAVKSLGKPTIRALELVENQSDGEITDLCFVVDEEGRHLFVATQRRVLCYNHDQAPQVLATLDTLPIQRGCMCPYEDDKAILVRSSTQGSPSEAPAPGYAGQLLTYTPDARAACIPVQYVPHALLTRLSPHRVTFLASKPSHASALSLTILDLRTRLEVHKEDVGTGDPVRHLVPAWGAVLVLRASGAWALLEEDTLPRMVAALLRKRIYEQAITIACEHPDGSDARVADIEAQYASHLLERAQEPAAAMTHFVNTIGFLPVSAVVKSFMGMQHAGLLAQYLEQVHAKGLMQAPHVRVLLGLYCQMRASKQLEAFISNSTSDSSGYQYDPDEAIKILLTGGHYELATRVARVSGMQAKVIDIMLHQVGDAPGVMKYITALPRADQVDALTRHGAQLIRDWGMEMEVTSLIGNLCTRSGDAADAQLGSITQFAHVYSHAPGALRFLCEFLKMSWTSHDGGSGATAQQDAEEQVIYHQLLQLYLSDDLNQCASFVKNYED